MSDQSPAMHDSTDAMTSHEWINRHAQAGHDVRHTSYNDRDIGRRSNTYVSVHTCHDCSDQIEERGEPRRYGQP